VGCTADVLEVLAVTVTTLWHYCFCWIK